MASKLPPKSEKKKQHFLPRSWMRRFADADGHVYGYDGGQLRPVAVADIMAGDWIYTVFDEWWRPSDRLEDTLAKYEGWGNILFEQLHKSTDEPAPEQWSRLLQFMALTVCRHPDVMARAHQLGKDYALALAAVSEYSDYDDFAETLKTKFGECPTESEFELLKCAGPDALFNAAVAIDEMQPQDPALPEQSSLEAVDLVHKALQNMDIELMDVPSGESLFLSDCPLPTRFLANGFSVPLSSSLALIAKPRHTAETVKVRRRGKSTEVDTINADQLSRRRKVIIGADRAKLEKLIGKN